MAFDPQDLQPGPRNGLLDVAGLQLGHAHDAALRSGVTLVLGEAPMTAAVDVRGGAPGTRETDVLGPCATVEQIDALVLSGGSAFGLEAASAVQAALAQQGRGFAIGPVRVPLVPQAILFDLLNGGQDYDPATRRYYSLGQEAVAALGDSSDLGADLGAIGAGYGALTAGGPGGLGMASLRHPKGWSLAALVAVNAVGSPFYEPQPGARQLWAAPWELAGEFGLAPVETGRDPLRSTPLALPMKGHDLGANTSIGLIATDLPLTQKQLRRLAAMAHNGLARALRPSHTPLDGDTLFAVATGLRGEALGSGDLYDLAMIGELLADCVTRAVGRGVLAGEAYWAAQG